MSIFDDILRALSDPLKPYAHTPESTLVVVGAALLLSLVAMTANRFLVNYKMVTNNRREYMTWMRAVNKARKEGDEKQLEKLMRRQSAVMKMNWRATLEQFKTYPVTIIPFYLIYYAVAGAFTGYLAVAFAPFVFPFATVTDGGGASVLSLFFWYLICSFTFSIPLSRIFGVSSALSMTPPSDDTK